MAGMEPRAISVDAVSPQPWRNGGGITRELLAAPDTGQWQWRVSVADIERDGPFSAWPGVQRWFAVLEGAGVALTIDGAAHVVTPRGGALRFDGDASTTCHLLEGPTRDLNLMLRGARGALEKIVDAEAWHPAASQCGLFAAAAGRCRADDAEFDVAAQSLLWFDAAPATLRFVSSLSPDDAGWWLSVTPREGER
jgi:environmental stress-induced protein Ves